MYEYEIRFGLLTKWLWHEKHFRFRTETDKSFVLCYVLCHFLWLLNIHAIIMLSSISLLTASLLSIILAIQNVHIEFRLQMSKFFLESWLLRRLAVQLSKRCYSLYRFPWYLRTDLISSRWIRPRRFRRIPLPIWGLFDGRILVLLSPRKRYISNRVIRRGYEWVTRFE